MKPIRANLSLLIDDILFQALFMWNGSRHGWSFPWSQNTQIPARTREFTATGHLRPSAKLWRKLERFKK
jgi:hypothetical protein